MYVIPFFSLLCPRNRISSRTSGSFNVFAAAGTGRGRKERDEEKNEGNLSESLLAALRTGFASISTEI